MEISKIKTYCFVGASFTTNNMGCSALAASAIRCALHNTPDARIVFLNYAYENCIMETRIGCDYVTIECANMRFSKKINAKGHVLKVFLLAILSSLIPFAPLRRKLLSSYYYTKILAESDVVCSVAGGDSFSDIYGMQRFLSIVFPMYIALFMKKPLILMPQTYGPFDKMLTRKIAGFLVNRSYRVFSRDYEGLEAARKLTGLKRNCHINFCHDMAFILDPRQPEAIPEIIDGKLTSEKNQVIVGLNVSGLLYNDACADDRMRFGLRDDYKKVVEAVARQFLSYSEVKLALVPHVFGEGTSKEADTPACKALYNHLEPEFPGRIVNIKGVFDQHEIKHIIGQLDFFAGSRMHACIAALSQCIPAVGIAYSKKFYGVFNSIGVDALVADLRYNDSAQIAKIVTIAFEQMQETKEHLKRIIPDVKKSVLELFSK